MTDSENSLKRGDHRLTLWIALAIVAAIVFALMLPTLMAIGLNAEGAEPGSAEYLTLIKHRASYWLIPLEMGGEIFLRVLKMLVVPLVMSSVMSGILGLGDVRKLGRPGLAAVTYYLSTTVLAVIAGLILVNMISPGVDTVDESSLAQVDSQGESVKARLYATLAEDIGVKDRDVAEALNDNEFIQEQERGIGEILENLVLMMFTDNLFESAVNTNLLPLIVFSLVFAGLLTTMGSRVSLVTDLIHQVNSALMAFILLIMKFAPLGIFCLVAARFGEANVSGTFFLELKRTWGYTITVLIGLALHAFLTLPLLLWVFTRRNPYKFMLQMSQAILTAFSTASSSATLPVTMESAVDEAGVSRRSVDFVLPLGATINMDGTALYEAVAAIFIAQVVGADMSLTQQIIVAVTATLAAIGAAGIPEAGLVTMVIVLTAVGLPVQYMTLILSVDWFLDRFRTAVNVFGDACGAAIVETTFEPEKLSEETGPSPAL
ncbi:dicarboxylate/amino acid:cation symporter [Thalassoglobus sp. JC818]|uniref:dicarboxylate/amino acid:cation symporter n=1 Tax=Thalassoglobus sp. JC818 TaxID=3232136 RepID=UPI0034574F40